jgi:hypothetical protein
VNGNPQLVPATDPIEVLSIYLLKRKLEKEYDNCT